MELKKFYISDFPNYIIYSNGDVYSIKTNKILKPIKHKNNYYSVTLWNNGESKKYLLHRLIAECFLPNPNNLPEVDHIDCDTSHNNVENLRWISREDNLNRSFDLLHQRRNKVKIKQFTKLGNLVAEYNSEADAFRQTGIRHISEVVVGKRKTAGGYIWERSDDL